MTKIIIGNYFYILSAYPKKVATYAPLPQHNIVAFGHCHLGRRVVLLE